ncbi:MAG TPA: hypothetical protein EYH34_15665, partial [Planctomycetes bacterium]|nr:hypothetical protein [Planctomycetota bacterium]
PRIHPDYQSLVIPPNIAPLNFRIDELGTQFRVRMAGREGSPIELTGRSPKIQIPIKAWRRLLTENRGHEFVTQVSVRDDAGQWRDYQPFVNRIAEEPIDRYLAYRRLRPDSLYYRDIGVYQRDLQTYHERVVLHGRWFREGCVNCHSFCNDKTDRMTLGFRSDYGDATLLIQQGRVSVVGARFGHTTWHPSGRLVAFSQFDIRLFYHTARNQTRDAMEFDSLLGYFRIDTQSLHTAPQIADKAQLETHPYWSPDGKDLYFASARMLWSHKTAFPPKRFAEVRYDMKRVSYDVDTNTWGKVQTVLSSKDTGQSILTPRVSPDGRFVLFCMCNYGCFALYQPESDLYLLDLKSGQYKKLDCNSEFAESWHAWSQNGRWIVFSSKRPTGVFTRLFLCYIDANGNASKPFVVPQRDPGFYDDFLYMYNVPEFATEPVRVSPRKLVHAVRHAPRLRVDAITSPTPSVPGERRRPYAPDFD